MGHLISKEGFKTDTQKVESIKQMDRPTNKEKLSQFLGMINYLAKFIPNLTDRTAPLRILLEKDAEWF